MITDKSSLHRLTPRQASFVTEYALDLNATQAAIRAGYSPRSADRIGHRLLSYPAVIAAVGARSKKAFDLLEITRVDILRELAAIAFSRLTSVASWNSEGQITLKPSDQISEDDAAAVVEVSVSKYGPSIKLGDKVAALKTLNADFLAIQRFEAMTQAPASGSPDADGPDWADNVALAEFDELAA